MRLSDTGSGLISVSRRRLPGARTALNRSEHLGFFRHKDSDESTETLHDQMLHKIVPLENLMQIQIYCTVLY